MLTFNLMLLSLENILQKSRYFNSIGGCKKLRTFFYFSPNISNDKERSQIQGLVMIVIGKKAIAGHSLPDDKLRFEKYPENESAHFFAN